MHTESIGGAREVKHTAYLFSGLRCAAVLPGTRGTVLLYNPVILCYLMWHVLPIVPRVYVFTYLRPFPLNLEHCFKTIKPTLVSDVTCILQQPKQLLCCLRARPKS